jgi:flagellar hook-associated protein FlgK
MGEIWGSGVGLALAALRQQTRAMKRLEIDMVAMDQPGFTKTIQEASIHYAGGNAIGITEGTLKEVTDVGAENQLRGIAAQVNRNKELAKYVGDYEKAFGQMGGSNAFITSGNKVVTTINTVCSHGGDSPANKRAVLDAVADHARQIKIVADKLQNLRNSASQELAGGIPEINKLLSDIASVNASMAAPESTSDSNISYQRQRRVMIDQLSGHMQINVEDNANSDFLIYTPKGRVLVQGSLAAEFIYTPPPAIDATQSFTAGTITLQSIATDPTNMESPSTGADAHLGDPSDPNYYDRRQEAFIFDVSSDFADAQGGAISGLMSFLQGESIAFNQALDSYAAGLRDSFNALHNLSSAVQPRATLQGSGPGYIGGSTLSEEVSLNGAGTLRVAVINTTSNLATLSADIDLSELVTNANDLCDLINNSPTLTGHVTASIVNGSLQITTTDSGCGISLGSVSGSELPTISVPGSPAYGFSEFFHLNDVVTTTPEFWRGGTIAGLASSLSVNSSMLSNPEFFSINKLRDDALGTGAQAVSGDPSIGRALSDLFTRTKISFQTQTGGTVAQTLEAFSSGLVKQVSNELNSLQEETEAQTEAYKQQSTLFSQEYGMDEQEIAIRSMQISKSQDLYFSFLNNYWRMMSRISEMGQ